MRFAIGILVAFILMPETWAQPALAGQDVVKSGLTKLLEAELTRCSGRAGIYVRHLGTGEEAAVRGDELFEAASTIKLATAVLTYRLADQGVIDLDQRYEIKAADLRSGGVLGYMDSGLTPTYRDLVTQMIILSDNSATDIMIARVGGKEKVNEFLERLGFKALRQVRTTCEIFRCVYELINPKYSCLTPADLIALAGVGPISGVPAVTERQRELIKETREEARAQRARGESRAGAGNNGAILFGAASPREMGRLLEGIEQATIVSKASSQQLKRMLRAQQLGTRKIPHYLTVPVGHKTGESSDVTNDVGMIYARSGTIIMAFFNMGFSGLSGEADERIGHVARLLVEYFDGAR